MAEEVRGLIFGLYINGKYENADAVYDLINPYNKEVIAQVAEGTTNDMKKAIDSAYRAFQKIKRMSALERAEILYKAAELLNEKKRSSQD